MYYKCQKINFKRGCSYIYSEDCIEKKKATVNPRKKDDKCFQYATTVALNYGEIESHPERVSNIILFVKKHNWDGTKYSPKIDDWKMFEKNNPTILYFNRAFISKVKSDCKKQIILLMIPNEE